jgi:uncharacterized protein (UPF0335 family)
VGLVIKKRAISGAVTRALQQGMMLPVKPQTMAPTLPRDVTELDDASLMGVWTELTAWTDYAAVQVSVAYAEEKSLIKRIERMEAKAQLVYDKVTKARAEVKASPEMEALVNEWLEAEAYRKLVEALFNNYDRDAQLLSRELTRRTSDVKGRQTRWQA